MRDPVRDRLGLELAIDQLVLRIPGLDRPSGQRVAELVARRLSLELPGMGPVAPSSVQLRIQATGLSVPALAELIARRIIEAVR